MSNGYAKEASDDAILNIRINGLKTDHSLPTLMNIDHEFLPETQSHLK